MRPRVWHSTSAPQCLRANIEVRWLRCSRRNGRETPAIQNAGGRQRTGRRQPFRVIPKEYAHHSPRRDSGYSRLHAVCGRPVPGCAEKTFCLGVIRIRYAQGWSGYHPCNPLHGDTSLRHYLNRVLGKFQFRGLGWHGIILFCRSGCCVPYGI